MQHSFFFYDLETSGVNPRESRIMQFAGQRTTLDLEPVGEPVNELITLTPDVLPEPDAVLITGITPQMTLADGRSEADYLNYFHQHIVQPGTIFAGFNSIRFDDEFMRYLHYRNFYDAYEWQWQEGRGKWDLLDVVRMTRALRPSGIEWPYASDGRPANRLEMLTTVNKLDHYNAHDALSDVNATIAVARLIRDRQPKLFEFLLSMRDKAKIEALILSGEPFVYSSGRYSSDVLHTTLSIPVMTHPTQKGTYVVYDLRQDPTEFVDLSPSELAERMQWQREPETPRLPVKQLQTNRCPAIAPRNVLETESLQRLKIDLETISRHLATLKKADDFADKLAEALRINEKTRQQRLIVDYQHVDTMLYDGFFNDADRNKMRVVRAANAEGLADLHMDFADPRLDRLLLLYKARQYPKSLTEDERMTWHAYRQDKLFAGGDQSRFASFARRLQELASTRTSTKDTYLLQELQLYAESLVESD